MEADLHIHSNYSDGRKSVDEIYKLKGEENLDFIAITDHDVIFEESYKNVINGIELSTRYNNEDIHLLGYFKNLNNLDKLKKYLSKEKIDRINRIKKICDLLKIHYNLEIDSNKIISENKGIIGRPHIAKEIARKYEIGFNEAFKMYLTDSSLAYVKATDLSLEDGIKLLHNANAIAIIAHPVLYKKTDYKELISLADGAECIYPENDELFTEEIISYCISNNKIITAGSDYHADEKHKYIGSVRLSGKYLDDFLKKLNS